MNSLNLQGISWNFFARDRCVSVSITQSRLIARGHHQRRLILFRVGSIPPKNYLFFFFLFFFFHFVERESVIPSLAVIRSLYHPPAPLEPRQVPRQRLAFHYRSLKSTKLIIQLEDIYIYIHTYRFCCSPPPPPSPLPHIFTVISGESDIVRLDMFTRNTARGNFWSDISYFLKIVKILHPYPILSLSRDFLILDVSSALNPRPLILPNPSKT